MLKFRVTSTCMVFNATFNNISVISLRYIVLLVEETGVPEENNRPVASQIRVAFHPQSNPQALVSCKKYMHETSACDLTSAFDLFCIEFRH